MRDRIVRWDYSNSLVKQLVYYSDEYQYYNYAHFVNGKVLYPVAYLLLEEDYPFKENGCFVAEIQIEDVFDEDENDVYDSLTEVEKEEIEKQIKEWISKNQSMLDEYYFENVLEE
jgi:hypothetical protein